MALGRGSIEIDLDARVDAGDIARQVQNAEKKIRPLKVSLDDKGFRQPLGRITGDLGEFQNALDASVARTLAFGAAVGVVNSLSNAFKGMVTSSIEVEKALSDVNVILNLTSSNLANFSKDLFDTARNTGQSFQAVSEAAVELARQGLGAEETIKRINDAMILTRLSGMDAAKSVAALTAAVNSFGDTAITTTQVVNKLASVDAAFAVSTEDLADALARAGASAQGAKVDMDELLAAVTSVQQQTARGGAVIGNAFKSIFTRLSRSGVREALEEIGVATTDAAGNIRGAMSILQDYAGVYSTLTDSQRAYTDELVAGVFQINNLKALVKDLGSDYSIYTRALQESGGATDEATRRNEKLQSTLSALVNQAAVNVKELASSLGELVATPAIENLLKTFNSLSGAISQAIDPEAGTTAIKAMFDGIGKFISGPGLAIVGLAFVKLFKFVTGQSVKALQEVFKINTAAQKTAKVEAQIGQILKQNEKLYHEISNESLTHEKREEMVLQTLKAQTVQYKAQEAMIAKLARSRRVAGAIGGVAGGRARASGYIPNFANNIQGAIAAERDAIMAGEGGASKGARTKVLNNFPIGGGRRETMVANTDEVIVPKFGGSSGSAIFNKNMIKKHGMPDGAIPVARGFIPSFAVNPRQQRKEKEASKKAALLGDPKFKQFWNGSGHGSGSMTVDTQKSTQGFGIIGGRGSPGMAKSGIKGPLSNPDIRKPFVSLAAKGMGINSKEAEDFAKLYSSRMTQFTNIPVNTVSNEPVSRREGESMLKSPISNLIQPHMADAVEKIATKIYSNYFGRDFDTAGYIKGVRASAGRDKQIVSRAVEGGIMESALKLGNKESAANIGKDESATWDFEPGGAIPGYLKNQFFGSKKVIRADAKRTVSDSERGKVLKKATDEVFPAQLAGGILDSIDQRVLKEARESFARRKEKNKADGFIPNFPAPLDWKEAYNWLKSKRTKQFESQKHLAAVMNRERVAGRTNWSGANLSGAKKPEDPRGKQPKKQLGKSYKEFQQFLTPGASKSKINNELDSGKVGKSFEKQLAVIIDSKIPSAAWPLDFGRQNSINASSERRQEIKMQEGYKLGDAHGSSGHTHFHMIDKIARDFNLLGKIKESYENESVNVIDINRLARGKQIYDITQAGTDQVQEKRMSWDNFIKGDKEVSEEFRNVFKIDKKDKKTAKAGRKTKKGPQKQVTWTYRKDNVDISDFVAGGFIPNMALSPSMISGLEAKLRKGSGATPDERKTAQKMLDKDSRGASSIRDAAILGNLKFTQKQVVGAIKDVAKKRNDLQLDPQPIVIDPQSEKRFAQEYIKKVNRTGKKYSSEKLFNTIPSNDVSLALEGKGGYRRKYMPTIVRRSASGFIPNFASALEDAISREKEALRSQGSSAKIYTDTDPRVAGPKNPMGLLVANTRDEPRSGSQGVERAIRSGEDPKTHGASKGFVPNYRFRFGKKKSRREDDDLEIEASKAQGAISKVTDALGQFSFAVLGIETGLIAVNGVLSLFTKTQIPSFSDGLQKLKDAIQGVDRELINAADEYVQSIDKQIASNARSVEKIDLISTAAAKFSKAVDVGNIDAAGKFMQEIFSTAAEVGNLNPTALKELLDAAGDSEQLVKATQNFKDLVTQGESLKLFGRDLADVVKKVEGLELKVEDVDTGALAQQLTKGLKPEQFQKISETLKNVTPNVQNSTEALKRLEGVFGKLDDQVLKNLQSQPALAEALLKSLKAQANYNTALQKVTENFTKTQLPVEDLSDGLRKLGPALRGAAENSQRAFEVLQRIGDIQTTARVKTAKAVGTVKASDEFGAAAASDIQKSIENEAKTTETALKTFASDIISQAKENTTRLSDGVAKIVGGISEGTVSNEAALQGLIEISRSGTAAEKELANKTLAEINKASNNQISQQKIIQERLRAQLQSFKTQAVAFQRNNQLGSGQLDNLRGISQALKEGTGIQKTSLERLSGLSSAIKTIESLGGDPDVIAELKESNAKLSQLENLKAAFENLTGDTGAFQADSLAELDLQIDRFISGNNFVELDNEVQALVGALKSGVETAREFSDQGGVKTKEDLMRATISPDSIKDLANQLSAAISEPIRELLGMERETVAEIEGEPVDVDLLAGEIQSLAAQNKENADKNQQLTEKTTQALLESIKNNGISLDSSSTSLQLAAEKLDRAADKLSAIGGSNAGGFIPSFSPKGEGVARAVKAERKLGGRPVVDYNKSIGTYVRDGKTQPNFAAVKRDHPEGVRRAAKNSAIAQNVLASRGFVPNFQKGTSEFITQVLGKDVPFVLDSSKREGFEGLKDSSRRKTPSGGTGFDHLKSSQQQTIKENFEDRAAQNRSRTARQNKNAQEADKAARKRNAIKLGRGGAIAAGVAFSMDLLLSKVVQGYKPTNEEIKELEKAIASGEPLPTPQDLGIDEKIIGEFIKKNQKWTADLPIITRAAYFGGKEFGKGESSSYEPLVNPDSLKKIYGKLSKRGIGLQSIPSTVEATAMGGGFKAVIEGVNGASDLTSAIKESSKSNHAKNKKNLFSLVSESPSELRRWNILAPHNKFSRGWRDFQDQMLMVSGISGLASFFPPAAPIMGPVSSITAALGVGAGAIGRMVGTDMDPLFGDAGKAEILNAINNNWKNGFFKNKASHANAGGRQQKDFAQNSEEAANLALGHTSKITKDMDPALWEAFEQQRLSFEPGLFKGFAGSRNEVAVDNAISQIAGHVLAGRDFLQGKTTIMGSLPGGADFITNHELAKVLGRKFHEARGGDGLRIPLDLSQQGGVGFKGWEPGKSTAKWSSEQLSKANEELSKRFSDLNKEEAKLKVKLHELEIRGNGEGPEALQISDFISALDLQKTGVSKAKDLTKFYSDKLKDLESTEWRDFMENPTFPDPNTPKGILNFNGLDFSKDLVSNDQFKNLRDSIPAFRKNDPSGTLEQFFERFISQTVRQNADSTKNMINDFVSPDIAKALTMFDPAGAKEGYTGAQKNLDEVNKFIRSLDTGELRKEELEGKVAAKIDEAQDLKDFAELDAEAGLQEGPRVPGKPINADEFPPIAPMPENEKIRDAIYLKLLGEQIAQQRVDYQEEMEAAINRIQQVQIKLGDYDPYLTRIIEFKKRSKKGKEKLAQKFSETPRASEFQSKVKQAQDEIEALEKRRDLYNSGDPAIAHLFYADTRTPTKVNDRVLGPSIWDAPQDYLSKYTALRKRLGLDKTPAEERLREIRQEQGADAESMRAMMAINFGPRGLSDLQKSEAIGGYGLYAQVRNQKGNTGGQAFKDKFKSMTPDQRLAYMKEFGAGILNFDRMDTFANMLHDDGGARDLIKSQILAGVGGQRPEFGFLVDQIFNVPGASRQKDLILHSIKEMGIPMNDIAPVGKKLKSASMSFKKPHGEDGTAKALPGADVDSMMDFLWKFQFDEWAKQNKDKLKDGQVPGLGFINEMLGQTSLADLGKFPSFWNYADEKGIFDIETNVKAILGKKDKVKNFSKWKDKYRSDFKTLTGNDSYGPFKPNPRLTEEPLLELDGNEMVNKYEKAFGRGITNSKKAAEYVMGPSLNHGINSEFQDLVRDKGVPFPDLGKVHGRREGLEKIWKTATGLTNEVYAPFGYTKGNMIEAPLGHPDKVGQAIRMVNERAAPMQRMIEEEEPANVGENLEAKGFIPNFAEILAAKQGEVELVKSGGFKSLLVGADARAATVSSNGSLAQLAAGSSYQTKNLKNLISKSNAVSMSLASLGISPNNVKGTVVDTEEGPEIMSIPLEDMIVNVKKLSRSSSIDVNNIRGKGSGIRGAAGFIPNFSAIAGEIAASKMAGYKSPVTSAQVKTMNIPGAGKAAYNTQEKVFTMPGVTQPFIRPPSTSKAAKSYKGAVQKKFGFDPYQTAAGGFVPNFAAGGQNREFQKAIKDFQSSTKDFSKGAMLINSSAKTDQSNSNAISKSISQFSSAVRTFQRSSSTKSRQAPWKARAARVVTEVNLDASTFDSSTEKFNAGVSSFGTAVSNLNFAALDSASQGFNAGVSSFGTAVSNLNFAALDSASQGFNAGVSSFGTAVSNLNLGAMNSAVSSFETAVSNLDFTTLGSASQGFSAGVSNFSTAVSNLSFAPLNSASQAFNAGVSSFGTVVSRLNFAPLNSASQGIQQASSVFNSAAATLAAAAQNPPPPPPPPPAPAAQTVNVSLNSSEFSVASSNFDSSVKSFRTAREEFGQGVTSFGDQVSSLESSLSRLDFSSLNEASSTMMGAASKFSEQANVIKTAAEDFKSATDTTTDNPDQSINLEPFTSAAGSMTSSIGSLKTQLEKPISLETASLEKSLKDLSSALANVQGTLDVEIPNVQVSVNGTEAASQIKQIVEDNVRSLIKREIANINWETKVGSVLS